MAPRVAAESVAALRAVSYYVKAASPSELPHVVVNVSQSIQKAKDLFAQSSTLKQGDGEAGIVLTKFYAQLAALLKGHTAEERFSATVLIKATVETGGWEVLSQKSKEWVHGLLSNLNKSGPPSHKSLLITTLTRIFMLTWEYPTLKRETTTPALEPFVKTCLRNLQDKSSGFGHQQTILESFAFLLPHHPTVFRNLKSDISGVLERYLRTAVDTEDPLRTCPNSLSQSAQRVASLLHYSEPKQGSSAAWEAALQNLLDRAHTLTDAVLVDVEENFEPTVASKSDKQAARKTHDSKDRLRRPTSVLNSSTSLVGTLDLLHNYLINSTAASVSTSVGGLLDLLVRIFTIRIFTSTTSSRSSLGSIQFRDSAGPEERDVLVLTMPQIHAAGLRIIVGFLDRFGKDAIPSCQTILDQICWNFKAESADPEIRTAAYVATKELLLLSGTSMNESSVKSLYPIMQACCDDLMPVVEKTTVGSDPQNLTKVTSRGDADSFLRHTEAPKLLSKSLPGLHAAAAGLLPILFSELPTVYVAASRRIQMERTAVFSQNKDALIASVMNPTTKQKNIRGAGTLLPFLARQFPEDPDVEKLLRPRMPVIKTNLDVSNVEGDQIGDEDDEDEESATEDPEANRTDMEVDLPADQTPYHVVATAHVQDAHPGNDAATAPLEPAMPSKKRSGDVQNEIVESKRQRPTPPFQTLPSAEMPVPEPRRPSNDASSMSEGEQQPAMTPGIIAASGPTGKLNSAAATSTIPLESTRPGHAELESDSEDDDEDIVLHLSDSSDEEEEDGEQDA